MRAVEVRSTFLVHTRLFEMTRHSGRASLAATSRTPRIYEEG